MSGGASEPPLPEEEHFEIALSLEQGERALFEREYARRNEGYLHLLGLLIVLVAVIVTAFTVAPAFVQSLGFRRWEAQVIALAVLALAVVAINFLYGVISVHAGWRLRVVDTNGWFMMTTVDGLWVEAPTVPDRLHPWAAFKSMIVSDTAIYLSVAGIGAIMLPNRVIGDRNDFHTFASVMAKYARL